MSPNGQADRMIGESAAFLQMQEQISRLAPLDKPVLVIGERGTGKELVAARLHYLSKRWEQTFLKLNCAAFNESLLESQLATLEPAEPDESVLVLDVALTPEALVAAAVDGLGLHPYRRPDPQRSMLG